VADHELVDGIRAGLGEMADPGRAPQMQAYMKSDMPYLGVRVPIVRQIVAAQLRRHPPESSKSLGESASQLWRAAKHREERYAATALTRNKLTRSDMSLLPLYQEMIVSGAWWDHVDEVSHRIGDLLLAHPGAMRPVVLAWSVDDDLWLRRAAIICQLGHRTSTDLVLLTEVITPNMSDKEFFIRKAIGWALRDYAWTDPGWVSEFVTSRRDVLSPLSIREATKNIK
jgi:3-methyladenine DNA glycosylase AlkD